MTALFGDLWFAVYGGARDDDGLGNAPRSRRAALRADDSSASDVVDPAADAAANAAANASDATRIARMRAGEMAAFEEIVALYADPLVQLATIMLHDRDAAYDVAQDVLARLWTGRASLVVHTSVRAYLMRAVANQARNVRGLQANRRRIEAAERDTVHAMTSGHVRSDSAIDERDVALWKAVHELPERWREAVLLRYVQQLSFAEVGGVLAISEDAAKKLVRRAIAALRAVVVEPEE